MKTPNFFIKLSAFVSARKKKKLNVASRTAPRAAMSDYDSDEPTTKLSSAFFVVFILHVVAIGGIYAFNGIKASRIKDQPPAPPATKGRSGAPHDAKAPTQAASPAKTTALQPANSAATAAPVPTLINPKTMTPKPYHVKAGDNPSKIAFAFSVKADELLAANNLKEGAILQVGQMLSIPPSKPAARPVAAEVQKADLPAKQTDVPPTRTTPGMHFIKKGDTATSIAKLYGRSAAEILKVNKISDAKKLQLGQALKIPPKKG